MFNSLFTPKKDQMQEFQTKVLLEFRHMLVEALVELDPDKRYILFLRQEDDTQEDLEVLRDLLVKSLDLANSNLRIAIVSGDVRLLEF